VEITTIGFTKHSAESFFSRLKNSGIEQLIDVRINNVSQLAGFAKRDDLKFFLDRICGASYLHQPLLAPTNELLKSYRDKEMSWSEYEKRFLDLMQVRKIENEMSRDLFAKKTTLLCSEHTAEQCHRRLVVEYLNDHWGNITITHL
jgi:uncharacterized protein (DUF488 family)